jgi:hypothetical protein
VDELLHWPWRRFERFYAAYLTRHAIEGLERRKDQMIASLWSNSNYDDDKGTRTNAIEELEHHYDEAIALILHGPQDSQEEDIDEDNPFFQPALRAVRQIEAPRADEGATTVRAVVEEDYRRYVDQ